MFISIIHILWHFSNANHVVGDIWEMEEGLFRRMEGRIIILLNFKKYPSFHPSPEWHMDMVNIKATTLKLKTRRLKYTDTLHVYMRNTQYRLNNNVKVYFSERWAQIKNGYISFLIPFRMFWGMTFLRLWGKKYTVYRFLLTHLIKWFGLVAYTLPLQTTQVSALVTYCKIWHQKIEQ